MDVTKLSDQDLQLEYGHWLNSYLQKSRDKQPLQNTETKMEECYAEMKRRGLLELPR